jgi:hypothetical protein
VQNGQATAYLGDGKKLDTWLDGRVDGAAMTLRGSGTSKLTGELHDGAVTGTATVNGASWPFTAPAAVGQQWQPIEGTGTGTGK